MSQKEKQQEKSFRDLKISSTLIAVLEEIGYSAMTEVQAQAIPHLLLGKDLIGQSKTGSGKTAAFSIPILEKIQLQNRSIQALILCPTRELCTQVAREIRKLGRKHPSLQVLILAGGQFIAPQLSALEKGVHIAVGTPGRVMDIIGRGKLNLSRLRTIVLDEADRMLDMGFEEDMQQIMGYMPSKRQTVLFSATFPESITSLSEQYQKNPVTVTIKNDDTESSPIKDYFIAAEDDKIKTLKSVLDLLKPKNAIIFCNLKAVTQEVAQDLRELGFSADCLNGDLEQFDRDRIMARFRNESLKLLVATDVAARGIDVEKLDLVVNFDTPAKPDVYVHRIGRTGRAGQKGVAISLLISKEHHKLDRISEYTKRDCRLSTIDDLKSTLSYLTSKDVSVSSTKEEATSTYDNKSPMVTLCIFGGRKDKLRPGDILGALTGETGNLPGSAVGKIEIHDRLTYVAIQRDYAAKALMAIQSGRIKARTFKVSQIDG